MNKLSPIQSSSHFTNVFVARERLKNYARTHIKPELSLTFCQSQARTRPYKPGPTYNSDIDLLWSIKIIMERFNYYGA